MPCKVPDRGWGFATIEAFNDLIDRGLIFFREDHTKPPMLKSYLSKDESAEDGSATVMSSIIYRQAQVVAKAHKALFDGKKVFENPKDHEVIGRLISYVTDDGDIVLDSFAGSGTTGHSVLEQNTVLEMDRKFILVELDEEISRNITAERLRRVINGYNENGDPDKPVEGLGGGFRYCRLGTPLFNEFGNIDVEVSFPDLAAHVFFSETGAPLPKKVDGSSPLIGRHKDKLVYLLFSAAEQGFAREASGNVLTPDVLADLPPVPEGFEGTRIVYAEGCTVVADRLTAQGVAFKQVPYQIEGA